MAEFDSCGEILDLFRASMGLKSLIDESDDDECGLANVNTNLSLDVHKQTEILESSKLSCEIDNDILSQTDVVDIEDDLSKNSDLLNLKEIFIKSTNLSSSGISTDNDNIKKQNEDNHNLENSISNGTAHAVHDCDKQACDKKKKAVSFPKDTIISGYLEPPDPWMNAPSWTTDELVSAYKNSCDLNGTKPIAKLIPQLQAMNYENQREELLSLKGEKLDPKQCECLEEVLKRTQFKMLDLEACHLEDETAVALFDMIEFYESTCQLNIAFNRNIQARGWQACSRLVRRAPNMTFLDLRNCDLNDRTIPIFGRALKLGCHLTILHMENMNLSGRPLLIFVAAIKSNEVLQELFLADNKLTATDGVQLGHLLHCNHKLRLLDLRNNHLQDVGTGHICDGLMEQNKGFGLRTLVLWNNSVTYQAMSTLGNSLASSQNLETLNIGHNAITNEGAHQLKYGLLRLNSLLRLGLQGSRISDEGAVALAEYIADTKVLLRIDLRGNDIKTAGLMALSHAMRVNSSVTRIDLDKEAKKEPGIKDYMEQQGRLIGDILNFQQRNIQTAIKKEEQERIQLKEKVEVEVNAAQKESEDAQATPGNLPANSSTESFTLIDNVFENYDDVQVGNIKLEHLIEAQHQKQHLPEKDRHMSFSLEEESKHQHRPNVLFPLQGLSPQTSLDSPAPIFNYDASAEMISDSSYECVSPLVHSSQPKVPIVTAASTPSEMILSPQYIPKQIARKIFSVVRVTEASSVPKLSPTTPSLQPVSYDPLSVSTVPLVPVSTYSKSDIQQGTKNLPLPPADTPLIMSPDSLLFQDLAKETINHMVSPDDDFEIKSSSTNGQVSKISQVLNINSDTHKNSDFNSSHISKHVNSAFNVTNLSETAIPDKTFSVPAHDDDGKDVKSSLFDKESTPSTFNSDLESCNNMSVINTDPSAIESNGDLSTDAESLLQLSLSQNLSEQPQTLNLHALSPKFQLKQSNIECGLDDNFLTVDSNDKTQVIESVILTNGKPLESNENIISHDSELFLSNSKESDTDFTNSKNETAAFLDLADNDCSFHYKSSNKQDESFCQLPLDVDELIDNSHGVITDGEIHPLPKMSELYESHEKQSVCLNNYNSPSLLVSQELSNDSFQEKNVIGHLSSNNDDEHHFSSIVDLLRLDICEMSNRKDMQIDAPEHTSNDIADDDVVNVISLVNDSIDIENVDFGIDEEPWLTVGEDTDGNELETSRKSLKQPDFFTTLSMNGLTQELASALTSLDGSNGPFDGEDYDLDESPKKSEDSSG